MEHRGGEAHGGWREGVVRREGQGGGEDAVFVGRAGGAREEGCPVEEVVFGGGACGYADGGGEGEGAVFGE